MAVVELALGLFLVVSAAHFLSSALALYRVIRPRPAGNYGTQQCGVSLVRPVCGVDQYDALTLQSSFELTHAPLEVIFCCASPRDPAAKLAEDLIARSPEVDAKLLLGDDRSTANPKLNNLIKGWEAARFPWIVLSDSNVLLPADYIETLFAAMKDDTGLVCSPPAGCLPEGFAAEVECAFLNSYQARWQLAADTIGLGFAQGKSMLWRRDLLDDAGGLKALGIEIAEDAAATKIVRRKGLRVRLVDRPFPQPLGYRSFSQVWSRQLRWARLRRVTFAAYFAPEVFTGILPALITIPFISQLIGADPGVAAAMLVGAWYLPEAILTKAAGWQFSSWTPFAWLARDLLISFLWIAAWLGDDFSWRGNRMTVAPAAPGTARG